MEKPIHKLNILFQKKKKKGEKESLEFPERMLNYPYLPME
jgi:hypothetical protein